METREQTRFGSITGRPLLNGLSDTFLIWTVVCPAKLGFMPFILLHKGRTDDCILSCALRFVWIRRISAEQLEIKAIVVHVEGGGTKIGFIILS